jgi:hypothetical protein
MSFEYSMVHSCMETALEAQTWALNQRKGQIIPLDEMYDQIKGLAHTIQTLCEYVVETRKLADQERAEGAASRDVVA